MKIYSSGNISGPTWISIQNIWGIWQMSVLNLANTRSTGWIGTDNQCLQNSKPQRALDSGLHRIIQRLVYSYFYQPWVYWVMHCIGWRTKWENTLNKGLPLCENPSIFWVCRVFAGPSAGWVQCTLGRIRLRKLRIVTDKRMGGRMWMNAWGFWL